MSTAYKSSGWRSAARTALLLVALAPVVAACGFFGGTGATVNRAAFSSKEYGVSASPRVSHSANPKRGGGRYLVGNPYTVRGNVYTPREDPNYVATGTASWYGSDFHGRLTANGEIFSANSITAAHPTLPIPSYVKVTNTDNGRSLVVRINDRGPYVHGRIIDLSHRAAELLGYVNSGMANVKVEYVKPAPLSGDDTRMLLATLEAPPGTKIPGTPGVKTTLFGAIGSLFAYADGTPMDPVREDQAISSAFDATDAMANQTGALQDWVSSVDIDARKVHLELGAFTDANQALDVAMNFAILGAIDEKTIEIGGKSATQLTMTLLKPGVEQADVQEMARQLGLNAINLY